MALPTPLQAFSGVPKINTAPDKQTIVDGEKMTGAQALIRSLEDLGVEDVFGIPGGAILPVYHEIKDNTKFRFVLMRHEQAAGHAAEGTGHWQGGRVHRDFRPGCHKRGHGHCGREHGLRAHGRDYRSGGRASHRH